MAPPAVAMRTLQAKGGVEPRLQWKRKKLLRSVELLRGSQIIFGLEQTVEKGKGCV